MDLQSQLAFFYTKLKINPAYHIDNATGCHLYNGSVRNDGYCHITYKNELNTTTSITAHRAALMVYRNRRLPRLQASHLCNVKTCINVHHLNLESNIINNQRKTCVTQNRCLGHPGYPACIIT